MSRSWIEKDTVEAREWRKRVMKECVQFAVDSWEERNLELNSEKNKIVSLKKRFKEFDLSRKELEAPAVKRLDEALCVMEKRSKDQLEMKMEILRDKIKKEKIASKVI